MTRHLPLVSDRDRISAARYTMLKLHWWMLRKRRRPQWAHWLKSNGGIISEREAGSYPLVAEGAVGHGSRRPPLTQ